MLYAYPPKKKTLKNCTNAKNKKWLYIIYENSHLVKWAEIFNVCDGVQDNLAQNMAPWHIEYFRLKKFVKQQTREGLSDLSLKPFIRPSGERCPLEKREHPWPWRQTPRGIWTNRLCHPVLPILFYLLSLFLLYTLFFPFLWLSTLHKT